MSLGLEELSDDQLVDLIGAACDEAGRRHPIVRKATQGRITTAAEDATYRVAAAKSAIRRARRRYLLELRNEVMAHVEEGVKAGEIKLIANGTELQEIAKADEAAKRKLIGMMLKIKGNSRLTLNIHAGVVTLYDGVTTVSVLQPVSDWWVADVFQTIARRLGIPEAQQPPPIFKECFFMTHMGQTKYRIGPGADWDLSFVPKSVNSVIVIDGAMGVHIPQEEPWSADLMAAVPGQRGPRAFSYVRAPGVGVFCVGPVTGQYLLQLTVTP